MLDADAILHEAVSQIRGQELKILDDFAKAYLSGMAYSSPKDIAYLIKHIQLNQQQVNEEGKFGYKYWYTLREDENE
jgi:hypothetical protein